MPHTQVVMLPRTTHPDADRSAESVPPMPLEEVLTIVRDRARRAVALDVPAGDVASALEDALAHFRDEPDRTPRLMSFYRALHDDSLLLHDVATLIAARMLPVPPTPHDLAEQLRERLARRRL